MFCNLFLRRFFSFSKQQGLPGTSGAAPSSFLAKGLPPSSFLAKGFLPLEPSGFFSFFSLLSSGFFSFF